jgi:hypothetical protein
MKTVRNSIIVMVAFFSLTMLACSNLSTSDDSDGTVENATLAELVGTWKMTSTNPYNGTTLTCECILTVSSDGSFDRRYKLSSSSSAYYFYSKGTLSTSGDELTMMTTHTTSNDTGLEPAEGDWSEDPSTVRGTALLVNGNLYTAVAKAEGSVSGIVGTWTDASYDSSNDPDFYEKYEYQFQSDGSGTTTDYYSTDGVTYSGDTPEEFTYVSAGNGSYAMTFTEDEATITFYCRAVDSYLLIGDATSADGNAFVKQ